MTLEEANRIAKIAGMVDNGCARCVSDVVRSLQKAFPEFVWTQGGEYSDEVTVEHQPSGSRWWW
jgi:hypothetical protein